MPPGGPRVRVLDQHQHVLAAGAECGPRRVTPVHAQPDRALVEGERALEVGDGQVGGAQPRRRAERRGVQGRGCGWSAHVGSPGGIGRGRPARGAGRRRPAGLGLLDGGDVEGELDLVGHEHVAAAERLVELHVPVAAVELAGDLEADPLVAPRVDVDALDVGLERDRLRDAVDRQVAGDAEGLVVDGLDRGRGEARSAGATRRRRSRASAGARRAAPRWCRPRPS